MKKGRKAPTRKPILEQLSDANLLDAFIAAIRNRNKSEMMSCLVDVGIEGQFAEQISAAILKRPGKYGFAD